MIRFSSISVALTPATRAAANATRRNPEYLGETRSGARTATESASIAVAWALLITVFVYRSLSWTHFLKACAKACKTTGVVLFLIGISSAFGYFMALYEVPQKTGELMKSVTSEPWIIFLMINVLLFVLGTFLDMAATILICTPIFLPIAASFGMDPVQFGILMLINCALGLNTPPVGTTQFVGCTDRDSKHVTVERLLVANQTRTSIASGERAVVILDRTPFYAESGGQVGDTGVLRLGNAEFVVTDTIKLAGVYHGHVGALTSGSLKLADRVVAEVDVERRAAIVLNHSATHLLHAALRQVLGEHVQQKGSLVAPDRLRFDFSHFQPMTDAELKQIETIVNTEVRRNAEAEVHQMSMQEALDFGAMALFGEKYGEHVRVLKMGEFSTELCGGTHVGRTGDIGLMKITSEGGIASGVRRIEAVTGTGAMALVDQREARLDDVAELVGASEEDVVAKLKQLLDRQKKLEKELDALKAKNANALLNELAESAPSIGGIHIVTGRIEGIDAKTLRDAVEAFLAMCLPMVAPRLDRLQQRAPVTIHPAVRR